MPWISVDESVRDHPKTRHLSRLLQCSRHEAIGILVMLWQWGLTNASREGKITYATAEDIAIGIMFTQASPKALLDALITAGWLELDDDGNYILHDWWDWQQLWYKAIDKRKANTEAQRQCRKKKIAKAVVQNNDEFTSFNDNIEDSYNDNGEDRGNTTLTGQEEVLGNSSCQLENTDQTLPISQKKSNRFIVNYQQIVDLFHTLCPSLPQVRKMSDSRKRAIASFSKKYSAEEMQLLFEKSSFLKGSGSQKWSATFDWLIKDSNAAKVIDGNYDDKGTVNKIDKNLCVPDYSDTSRYTNITME